MDSVRQVSQDLDTLAQAIIAKNKELNELKTELNLQIKIVNRYIELLADNQLHDGEITVAELEKIMTIQPCSQCNNDDVIVVPRRKLKLIESTPISNEPPTIKPVSPKPKYIPPKSQGMGKKTCSYCQSQGHKRAMCPERLATPKNSHS